MYILYATTYIYIYICESCDEVFMPTACKRRCGSGPESRLAQHSISLLTYPAATLPYRGLAGGA